MRLVEQHLPSMRKAQDGDYTCVHYMCVLSGGILLFETRWCLFDRQRTQPFSAASTLQRLHLLRCRWVVTRFVFRLRCQRQQSSSSVVVTRYILKMELNVREFNNAAVKRSARGLFWSSCSSRSLVCPTLLIQLLYLLTAGRGSKCQTANTTTS